MHTWMIIVLALFAIGLFMDAFHLARYEYPRVTIYTPGMDVLGLLLNAGLFLSGIYYLTGVK
jgi:hypothetical protein